MTNDEMLDKVKAAIGETMSISMSKEGTFLTIGNQPLGEITTEQACIMWDLMPLLAGAVVKPAAPVGNTARGRVMAEETRPHWAEEIGQEIRMLRTYNAHLINALARIAHSDAQHSGDAMKMRNIATAILHPDKAEIYDPTLPTYRRPSGAGGGPSNG